MESEIRGVLTRPKFTHHVSHQDCEEILALIGDAAVRVTPTVTITDCRDRKDNKYLELAASVAAEFIISSDMDLLILDPWQRIRILLPREYLEID